MATKVRGKRRVVIYCRISDDREGRRWGVDRQERACRERAEDNGWEVVAVLVDNDASAYSGKRRPQYEEMLRLLREDQADAVLALSDKRLARRLQDSRPFLEMVERLDVAVETIKEGTFNLSKAAGWGIAHRAAVSAEEESREIGERVRDAKADNVARGEYRGGPRPFGYDKDGMTPRTLQCPGCLGAEGFRLDRTCRACGAVALNAERSEAWWVEWATDQVLARRSLRGVAAEMAAAGVLTAERRRRQADGTRTEPQGQPMDQVSLRAILLRPRNAGLLEVAGEVAGQAAWPALLGEEKWRACRALLRSPQRRSATTNVRTWLGSGLYRCGAPGCTETLSTNGSTASGIKYRHTGHLSRGADALDAYVSAVVTARLARDDVAPLLAPQEPGDGRDLAAEANALRAKLDALAADYADDLITRKQMVEGTARARAKLAEIDGEMGLRAAPPVLAGVPVGSDLATVREAWKGYGIDRRRAIIDALCDVVVLPVGLGRSPRVEIDGQVFSFNPESVRFDWR